MGWLSRAYAMSTVGAWSCGCASCLLQRSWLQRWPSCDLGTIYFSLIWPVYVCVGGCFCGKAQALDVFRAVFEDNFRDKLHKGWKVRACGRESFCALAARSRSRYAGCLLS